MSDAKLILNGEEYVFPVFQGTEGETGIDIAKLRGESKAITFDPGYGNTGACKSAITFINGEKGILRHRGYAIEDLAAKATFPMVANLLMHGELPSEADEAAFEAEVLAHTAIPDGLAKMIQQFPADAHPMSVLSSMVAAMSAYYPDYDDNEQLPTHIARLMGHMRTFATSFYRHSQGENLVAPDPSLPYCGNFLRMMFGKDEGYEVRGVVEKALNMLLIVHADHEQNCSTSTVRMVGSSQASLYASISAGISALWGPLHGGANQAVIEMLQAIHEDGGDYAKYMEMAKDKDSGFRLMGFGHRVYKNFDPRATILKSACDEVLEDLGVSDPLLDIAKNLERIALEDSYFVERNLYPNVDFYSGIIYRGMGIPVNMFTAMFTIGRLPGWIAHWLEQESEGSRIQRPRQIYTGHTARTFPS